MKRSAPMAFLLSLWISQAAAYDCSPQTYALVYPQMDSLFHSGILQKGQGISVMVNEDFWRQMPFNEKQAFSDRLVCAIAGSGKGLSLLTFRSNMTGNPIGEWSFGTLKVLP